MPEQPPENPKNPIPFREQEMLDEFWAELSEKTGIIFPLTPITQNRGRMGQIFQKKSNIEPEARLTKGRPGSSKVRNPKQQRRSSVRLREEAPPQEDPFTRKPQGAKIREEAIPPPPEQRPARKSNIVLKDRDGKSEKNPNLRADPPAPQDLPRNWKDAEIWTSKSQGAKIREEAPPAAPEQRPASKSPIVLKDRDGKSEKNPNLRSDPPAPQDLPRKWKEAEIWTPDWIRHHTYNDDDRIRYGRLMEIERRPNLEEVTGHGQIRYGLYDNPHFTTDSGYYWKAQENEPFMDIAEQLAKKYAPKAKSWGDIEGGPFFLKRFAGTRTLCYSDKIRRWWKPNLEGVNLFHTDRMLTGIRTPQFDVSFVLHLTKAYPVDLDSLFAVSRLAVVLVYPYEWQEGTPDQVGMNEEWLGQVTRQTPTEHRVGVGTTRRGVAIYQKK